MTTDQPRGIDPDDYEVPDPTEAAERVREFISAWGDGRIDEVDGNALYARDLEALARTALEATPTTDGAALIAAERRRQVEEEGWTPEHDAEHPDGVLARAAVRYAAPEGPVRTRVAPVWPWPWHYWKPTPNDRVRELVKAGALIAAEIDRLAMNGGEHR
ncbi:hypothetical protein SAMN05216184_104128 [Georgenia satyanarayanai]|uniref:Uncharacterized protein n=1 Tax=Georgenia satyanarayanai TaxID=860221 RepID=A0A2Y9AB10_9MICO|nr:hypothetical protein [Georgenia satyanarayanai]PYG00189.1 hypothetical protein A8987_104128 [Georgenia satyanarayanai]SSA40428.1 hypothetical protein SAMN05216184_104128 [Georgenia satyanarayanai]